MIWLLILKVFLWSSPEVHRQIAKSLSHLNCNYTALTYGKSNKGRSLKAYYVRGRTRDTIMVTAGVHGSEKGSVLVAANLLIRACAAGNRMHHTLIVVPIMNPDGFSKYGRRNSRRVDLNRDAFTRTEVESKELDQLARAVKRHYNLVAHVSLHMTGNILIRPPPKTKAYKASRRFAKYFNGLGRKLYTRNVRVHGTWNAYFSSLGVPSVLLEIGRSKHGLAYTIDKQVKYLHPHVSRLAKLATKKLPKN